MADEKNIVDNVDNSNEIKDANEDKGGSNDTSDNENTQQDNIVQTVNIGGRDIPIKEAEAILNDTISSSTTMGTESLFSNIEQEQYYETLKRLNISVEDISLLNELKSGNKDAVLFLLKQSGINPEDIDEDKLKEINLKLDNNILVPKEEIEINRLYRTIGEEKFSKILNSFDEKSKEVLFGKDKELALEIANDIDIGLFDKAIKEVKLDKRLRKVPKYIPDIELYFAKVTEIVKEQQKKRDGSKKKEDGSNVKKQVSTTKGGSSTSTNSKKKTISNYLKIKDDKEFLEVFNKEVGDI